MIWGLLQVTFDLYLWKRKVLYPEVQHSTHWRSPPHPLLPKPNGVSCFLARLYLCVYLEIWPQQSGVKWSINLCLDVCRPLHRSHFSSATSEEHWPWLFRRSHPSRPPSICIGPEVSAEDTRCSHQRLCLSRGQQKRVLAHLPRIRWELWFHSPGGKTQVRSCCRTSKPRPRKEIYTLVVFPCRGDPCLDMTLSLLWQLGW